MLLFGDGDEVNAVSHTGPFFSPWSFPGNPLGCLLPGGGGSVVMNSQEELRQVFSEYQDGAFIKAKRTIKPTGDEAYEVLVRKR